MFRSILSIWSLLFAAAILVCGNGLQGTLLAVRADIEGFSPTVIGALMSAYFAGFMLGCRLNPGFIKSVGHIRTFVALASIASASTLVHPLYIEPLSWGVLRAVTGFCFAGLVMVIESWINEKATNANRGRILSVYRVVDLSATMAGNALLATASPGSFHLFAVVSMLLSIGLVPVALTAADAPKPIATARLNLPRLYKVSPLAAIGAPLIGLANAAFWAMGPVYAQKIGYGASAIAAFMSAVIIGAATLQWPLGWLSDRVDRRIVMVGSSLLGIASAVALARFGGLGLPYLLGLGALFGAFVIPMFGLTAAHANDHADPGSAVETNGGLLLLHGGGSVIGATLGAAIAGRFGAPALFYYVAAVYGVFLLICLYRMALRPAARAAFKKRFAAAPIKPAPAPIAPTTDETDAPPKS